MTGDTYVSSIVSFTGVQDLEDAGYACEFMKRTEQAILDVRRFEAGPITDMAINQRTGKSRYQEKI